MSKSYSDQITVHDYDKRIDQTMTLIKRDSSAKNYDLICKYDDTMISEALAKATRLKQLQVVLNLTRGIKKDWTEVTKDDVDSLVAKIMRTYANENGQESNVLNLASSDK